MTRNLDLGRIRFVVVPNGGVADDWLTTPKNGDTHRMVFAIKAELCDVRRSLEFTAQKTMYGGKNVAAGDALFIFASENEGGRGLIALNNSVGRLAKNFTLI